MLNLDVDVKYNAVLVKYTEGELTNEDLIERTVSLGRGKSSIKEINTQAVSSYVIESE